MWDEIYDRIAALVGQHRSTLVFVNTRRLAERVAHHLAERLGKDAVAAHHGSLSRKLRLAAERKLKAGEVRVLVATASLELGIDIGPVDLVCQIGSPRSIAVALQRIGRAGHWRGAIPKGRIFATTRDELLECAALVRAMRRGELDRLQIPEAPLDILAQQIVAACAAEDWQRGRSVRAGAPRLSLSRSAARGFRRRPGDAFRGHRRAPRPLRRLSLSRPRQPSPARAAAAAASRPSPAAARFPKMRSTPSSPSPKTPSSAPWTKISPWRAWRATSCCSATLPGASAACSAAACWWKTRMARRPTSLLARRSAGAHRGTFRAVGRAARKDRRARDLRRAADAAIRAGRIAAIDWLKHECGLDDAGAEQAVEYILAGRAVLGAVPTQKSIIAERFFDESGGMQLVIHAPFGARINKAWGLALRKRFCRSFNFELQAAATDNGLNISLGEQHSFPLADVFHFLHAASVQAVLEQAVLASPLFTRALALGRRARAGAAALPGRQESSAADSAHARRRFAGRRVSRSPRLPGKYRRRYRDSRSSAGARNDEGRADRSAGPRGPASAFCATWRRAAFAAWPWIRRCPRCSRTKFSTPIPTPISTTRRSKSAAPAPWRCAACCRETLASEIGRLDPAAIEEVRADAWPDVRDADELHDALLTLVALPELDAAGRLDCAALPRSLQEAVARSLPEWRGYFEELAAQQRATRAMHGGRDVLGVRRDERKLFGRFSRRANSSRPLPEVGEAAASREDALFALLSGWMAHAGPTTAQELSERPRLAAPEIDKALLRLEASGSILRGQFTERLACATADRMVRPPPARAHSPAHGRRIAQADPAGDAGAIHALAAALAARRARHATRSASAACWKSCGQLQGFEAPANAWERQILQRRVADYEPEILDQLCLTGAVGWGRLSPHPATLASVDAASADAAWCPPASRRSLSSCAKTPTG